ncbi:MAG: type II toxin-antitoxin system VapC family toxin [Candidatus Woesearchaeota archaeon]
MIGVDSSFLIDLQRKNISQESLEMTEVLAMSHLVFFECLSATKTKKEEMLILDFEKHTTQIPNCFESIKLASYIFKELQKKGDEIGRFDCLIASAYLTNGVSKILTRNKKHFEKIPGITCIEY